MTDDPLLPFNGRAKRNITSVKVSPKSNRALNDRVFWKQRQPSFVRTRQKFHKTLQLFVFECRTSSNFHSVGMLKIVPTEVVFVSRLSTARKESFDRRHTNSFSDFAVQCEFDETTMPYAFKTRSSIVGRARPEDAGFDLILNRLGDRLLLRTSNRFEKAKYTAAFLLLPPRAELALCYKFRRTFCCSSPLKLNQPINARN